MFIMGKNGLPLPSKLIHPCPINGSFVGYKIGLTIVESDLSGFVPCLITLAIPSDAKRGSTYGYKCRCNKAKVLDITTLDGQKVDVAISQYDNSFVYKINTEVSVTDYDEDLGHECAPGIHFFMTKEGAIKYWGG